MKIVFLACLLVLISSASSLAVNLDSLLALSVGGPEAVERINTLKSIIATGTVDFNGQPGTSKIVVQMPDKLFVELKLGGITLAQGYDGRVAWQKDMNGSVTELSGHEAADIMRQVYLQTYSYLTDDRIPGGEEYIGIEDIGGRPHHKIHLMPLYADTMIAYIDVQTGLPTLSISRLDDLESRNVNSDFRTVSDIVMPFFSRSEIVAASLSVGMQIEECLLDEPVDPGIFSMSDQQLSDFRFPSSASSVTLPFQMELGHIYVKVTVNGKRVSRFILDSGASSNILNHPTFEADPLVVVGQLPTRGVSGFETADLVRTDSISIGELTLYHQTAGSIDLGRIGRKSSDGIPFGGLLGYDFLSRFPILIKYGDSTITVFNPSGFEPPAGGVVIPFDLTMRVPTVDGMVEGVHGRFIVDLGNALGLILHPHFIASHGLDSSLDISDRTNRQFAGVGGSLALRIGMAEQFLIGELLFENTTVLVPDSGSGISGSINLAGNIGNAMLEQFDILLDYASQSMIVYDRGDNVN